MAYVFPSEEAEAAWGAITGTLSDQTDLQTALDNKLLFLNGFDLQDSDTLGDLAFNDGTRTLSIAVKSGKPNYSFWADNTKFTKTTTASVVIPDTTGVYYVYFDNLGVLQHVTEALMPLTVIYENALIALVYWNATAGTAFVGDERHGVRMSSSTHAYNHKTFGARYESPGLNITGLEDGEPDYTNTSSGAFWDEDIRHVVALQTTHPFMYKLGTGGEWTGTTPDSNVGFKNSTSNVVFNENDGGDWKLTESGTSTDYMIYFFIATPDINGFPIKKIIGQNGYPNRSSARAAVETEISNIVMDGLPSPEFIFLYAYIVKRNGDLENLADGGTYVDLRTVKGGISGISGSASLAADVTTDVTNFNNILSASDTNVQLALDTIDNNAALQSNVLELDNATSFTPDADYEPATKKYVDDNILDPSSITYDSKTSNYTLALSDKGKGIAMNSSSNLTVTIPTNASVAIPIGDVRPFSREGTGTVTFTGAGVTIQSKDSKVTIAGQYGEAVLRKKATDTWALAGSLE